MNWDDLRYFLAVASGGGLSGASRALGVSQATISRHITALERSLDVRLFEHRHTGYILSPAGEDLLTRARRIEAEIFTLAATNAAPNRTPEGDVRLTAPEFLGAPLLVGSLGALKERYPRLRLELLTGSPATGLSRYETDIALRFDKPIRGNFRADGVFAIGFGVYASRSYVDAHGQPRALDDFTGHKLIDFDDSSGHTAPMRWLRSGGRHADIVFRGNSVFNRMEAARAGHGIVMLPSIVGDEQHDLVPLFPASEVGQLDMYMLISGGSQNAPRVIAAASFVRGILESRKDALAGNAT